MLLTRCPECDTTFRVTDDALKKANGQVRCGRCATVFNAYAELRETANSPSEPTDREPSEGDQAAPAPASEDLPPADASSSAPGEPADAPPPAPAARLDDSPAAERRAEEAEPAIEAEASTAALTSSAGDAPPSEAPAADAAPELPEPSPATGQPGAEAPPLASGADDFERDADERPADARAAATTAVESPAAGPSAGIAEEPIEVRLATITALGDARRAHGKDGEHGIDALVADMVAQVERGGAAVDATDFSGDAAEPGTITPDQIDAVLGGAAVDDVATETAMPRWARTSKRRSYTSWWIAGCALCAVALALQTVNHFRSQLVSRPVIGPTLQHAYALLGISITPRVDVHDYLIVDWIASAEPNSRGRGRLKITAQIQNRALRPQPYPSVQLKLKDRFEAAVGTRIFSPNEYLSATATRDRLMAPGETARAELVVVDPGPDAYGFELDVCIEVEARALSCGSDKVFL